MPNLEPITKYGFSPEDKSAHAIRKRQDESNHPKNRIGNRPGNSTSNLFHTRCSLVCQRVTCFIEFWIAVTKPLFHRALSLGEAIKKSLAL